MHSIASKEANKKFDNFLNQKTFSNFNDLTNTINTHNKNLPLNSYIDVPLEAMQSHAGNPTVFKETILKIYNTLSYFFGKNYGYKILRTLAISKQNHGEGVTVNGETAYAYSKEYNWGRISMSINETVLMGSQPRKAYYDGWFTTSHMYGTFVHEFGHVIDNFHKPSYEFHEKFDTISGLESDYSKFNAHNEYKKNNCLTLSTKSIPCPYKFNKDYLTSPSTFKTSYETSKKSFESISQIEALTDFILRKIKNLKLPGKNFDEQETFARNMLLKIFINSEYGRNLTVETQSEGFAYWLLTPENERDKAWEIWNEFFLEYLPKLRADTPHFNDYLENQKL